MFHEIDGVFPGMTIIDFQGSCARCIIDRRVLEAPDFSTVFNEGQELYINLVPEPAFHNV